MAKSSSSFSLLQWIFLLLVFWGAIYMAARMLNDQGVSLEGLFWKSSAVATTPQSKPVSLPGSSKPSADWLAPVDEAQEEPERTDGALLAKFEGRPMAEIVAELKDGSGTENAESVEAIRIDEGATGMESFAAFEEVAEETGLRFRARNLLNGSSGLAVADLDGDRLLDLVAPRGPESDGLLLARNRGDGEFESITGAGEIPGGPRIERADFDNDGDLDLWVVRDRLPNSLLMNEGDGTFSDVTEAAGLLAFGWTSAAQWVDFDRDGWIDLFVARNPEEPGTGEPSCRLYRNGGDGTFRDLAWETGLRFRVYIRDCAWTDIDRDGFPDLAVSTFEMAEGEGGPDSEGAAAPMLVFRAVPAESSDQWRFQSIAGGGLAEVGGMGRIAFSDYDQDGAVDLWAGGDEWSPLRLFRNGGQGYFEEVSGELGLGEVTGVLSLEMADLNGDGHEDLALGTIDQTPNRVFLNRAGDRFREVTGPGGFGIVQATSAVESADLNGDGDLELLAAADWTGGAVFSKSVEEGHRWLALDLEGVSANRAAIGARVSLVVRDRDYILHRIERIAGGPRVELGLGDAATIESLEIEWPVIGWPVSRFTEVPLDRLIHVREGEAAFEVIDREPFPLGGGAADDGTDGS